MSYRTIRFDVVDGVATITLDRPAQRNAFGDGMGDELVDAYRRCDADDDVRAVVLTGTPPAFCAGADLAGGGETFAAPSDPGRFRARALEVAAWDVRKPVIAAVNGHAIGLGLTLALQCDIRIFATDAVYGVVQARRGVLGDAYSHWTLPRIAGLSAAAEILLTGTTFDGHEAERLRICSRALPNDEVLAAAHSMARDIADHVAPLSAAASKRLLWESWTADRAAVEQLETDLHLALMGHHDSREGVLAFIERRRPEFTGSVSEEWSRVWPTPEPHADKN